MAIFVTLFYCIGEAPKKHESALYGKVICEMITVAEYLRKQRKLINASNK